MKRISILLTVVLILSLVILSACTPQEKPFTYPVDNEPEKPFVRPTDDELVLPPDEPNVQDMAAACVEEPEVEGIVLEVRNEEGIQTILVASDTDIARGKIWITITDETDFFEDIDPVSSIGVSDVSREFIAGNNVAIFVNGLILESYPMQAAAFAVYENSEQ